MNGDMTPVKFNPEPVFILGITQRSGTNFLSKLLGLHPDCVNACVIPEDFLTVRSDLLVKYSKSVYESWPNEWGISDIMGPPDELCQAIGSGLIAFLKSQFTKKQPGEPNTVSDNHGTTSVSKPKLLITKTPSVKNLRYFFKVFPAAYLLILIRDGRAVVESKVNTFTHWSHEMATREWAEAANTIIQFTEDPDNYSHKHLTVRYEDLHQNTKGEMQKILSFLGLDVDKYNFDAALDLPVLGSSESSNQGTKNMNWEPVKRWSNFNPTQRWKHWKRIRHERFNWVAGDYLVKLGYEKKVFQSHKYLWVIFNKLSDFLGRVISIFTKAFPFIDYESQLAIRCRIFIFRHLRRLLG